MTLMDGNEQLLKALKPIIAMREEWFAYADDMPVLFGVQVSAQRIDYLFHLQIVLHRSLLNPLLSYGMTLKYPS